ncbi:T7SS effector LXG polymorphic toxin [Priestia koreensis]|uniref:T7SS effector LXG polymorphic toxin n=1 Tax=Priestia koreensis TaxID=284581 RepID=UPI0030192632
MGKVYDAEGISTFAKEREKSYKALKKQLDALKKTLQAVVDLDDSLKGKGADKIKGFYRYQVDTADNWIDLVGMLQSHFSTLYVKAEEAKLSGETFVTVPFLEQDVQNGISQAKKLVDQQQTDLQKIFNTIDDILPLSVFSKETYDEYMDKAEKKRNSTVNAVEKLDADWLESYSAIDSNRTIVTTSTQLLHDATTKGGQAYPVLFDEKAYHESPLYQVGKEANEYATNYIDYNKEMEEVHKLKEEEKRREIEEANKEWYEKAWDAASTFTGEVTGYYDSKRAVEGIDPVTGRKLSASERVAAGAMAAAGFIPVVGWAGRAIKGGKGIYAVAKGVNAADHALDAYKTTKSLEVLSKAEKGLYGLVAANGLYEFGTGKDMFGNEISDEQRQNSLLQSLGIVGAGVVSTKLAAKTAKAGANAVVTSTKKLTAMRNVLSTQATERLIPAVQKGQRVYRAVANEVKNTMKKIGEIKLAPKSIKVFQTDGAPIPIWMVDDWYKVKDLGRMFSVGGRGTKGTGEVSKIDIGKTDIDALRKKWNVPETETVAVGKTDVKGLEDLNFEGGSPKVRKEAGLPDLDEVMPDRNIKAPGTNPLFTRHAEEGVLNEFDSAVINAGIKPEDVTGTLKLHQSNPSGVCRKCYQGLANDKVPPGVLKQLSLKYPNLKIEVTSEIDESIKVTGRLNLMIKNGKYID